jgi:hypothetical protein
VRFGLVYAWSSLPELALFSSSLEVARTSGDSQSPAQGAVGSLDDRPTPLPVLGLVEAGESSPTDINVQLLDEGGAVMSLTRWAARCFVLIIAGNLMVGSGDAKAASRTRSLVEGNARFQVLAPNLVRMEYSPERKFTDEASVAVLNRSWPETPFQVAKTSGWLEIKAEKLTVRYHSGTGPFSAQNMQVIWNEPDGEHTWKPGDKDDKNLGGVPGDTTCWTIAAQQFGTSQPSGSSIG